LFDADKLAGGGLDGEPQSVTEDLKAVRAVEYSDTFPERTLTQPFSSTWRAVVTEVVRPVSANFCSSIVVV